MTKYKNSLPGENFSRRIFNQGLLGALGVAVLAANPAGRRALAQAEAGSVLNIGIIGSGRMGGSLGLRWAEAGHRILFSSRNPDELQDLVAQAGANARAGYPQEAAEFGDAVLIAVPYGALPQVGRDYASLMQGKVVIDCGNPRENRDGPMAVPALEKGTGVASAEYLPGVRLVRAFNAVSFTMVRNPVRDDGRRIGLPIAGDDAEAVAIAERLAREVGFDPVVVGPLSRAREFDAGTPVYVRGMTAAELREALGI